MKKKILFVLPSLRGGGAERVMLTVLKHLDRTRFELHLALVSMEGPYVKDIPPDVAVHDLRSKRVRSAWKPVMKLVWDVKPDTILSTIGHLNMALIALKPFFPGNVRLLVRESSIVTHNIGRRAFVWKTLYRLLYPRADNVICQSEAMADDLRDNFAIPAAKMVRIYNPVDVAAIRQKAETADNPFRGEPGPHLVAVGRLSPEKGFERLIAALPPLLAIKPDAKLWLVGTGAAEAQLRELCDRLGLRERVVFAGFQDNPFAWIKHADLFVLSSYYEGLPNALLEAIALGCPVLTLEHPGGTGEIMRLTRQPERMLARLDWREEWFSRPDRQAGELLSGTFGLQAVVRQYADIL